MRWIFGTHVEEKCIQRLGGSPKGNRPPGRPSSRWEVILNCVLNRLGSMGWINMAKNRKIADPYEHGNRL
jgi:hypothetical protein